MHVLITSDTVGGVWTYTQELVAGLLDHQHQVTLVSFGKLPLLHQTTWIRGLSRIDYRPTEYALEWMETAEKDIEESKRYLQLLIEEVKPDVLHISQYCYGDVGANIPKIVVAHSDVVSWWQAVHSTEPDNTPWIRHYRKLVCEGLEGADVVVAPSHWMLNSLAGHHLRPASCIVVYNGRSPAHFNPDRKKENFVLSVGRLWDAGKQVSLLLRREMQLPVCIVGWGHEPGRERAENLFQVPSNVQLLGQMSQAELRDYYARAAIYVATSCYEPFGLAPLEAALSRCALVMNDTPVFHELWDGAAIFFKKDDPDDLARVLADVSADARLRETYADLAYRRGLSQFSAESMVHSYENIYESVATARVA